MAKSPSTGGVRFAPSPTGRFHVGNLRTAWVSFQFSKTLNLPWIVRYEDIDTPRVLAGAQAQQREDLKQLGLIADFELLQSNFRERHWELFVKAIAENQIYPCDCSRKEVQLALSTMASAPHSKAPTYSGRCRTADGKTLEASETLAWRFKMPDQSGKEDFIIARTSIELDSKGLPSENTFAPAYHWACAIDDHDGNYDLLVRSSDLKESLIPQRAIQKWIGRKQLIPVFHTSLITQDDGKRLEKRTAGVTLPELANRGLAPASIIEKFEKSLDKTFLTINSPGEPSETLTLSQIGI